MLKEIVGIKAKSILVEPLKMNENLLLSVNTSTTIGIIISIKDNVIELNLKIPIIPFTGERVGIARNYQGHWRLIGWGEIL